MNASRLQMSLGGGTTTNDRVFIRQSLTSQTDYYFSVYLKSTNGTEQKLNWHYGSDDFLITVTNEWQRFFLPRNGSATVWAGLGLRGNLVSAIGIDDSIDILVYGFQVEQGSYATNYIPTSGGTETRNAELCTSGGNADLFNDDEGVLFIDVTPFTPSGSSMNISLNDGTSSNRITFLTYQTNQIRAFSSTGFSSYQSITIGERIKAAISYKQDDFKFYLNGVLASSSSSINTPLGLDSLDLSQFNGSLGYQGKVHDIRY